MCFLLIKFIPLKKSEKIAAICELWPTANTHFWMENFQNAHGQRYFCPIYSLRAGKMLFHRYLRDFMTYFLITNNGNQKMEITVKLSIKPKFFTNFAEKSSIFSLTLCLSPNCPTLELCVCQMVISCILWITKSPVCAFMCLLSKLLISGMKSRKFHANFELRPTATTHF